MVELEAIPGYHLIGILVILMAVAFALAARECAVCASIIFTGLTDSPFKK